MDLPQYITQIGDQAAATLFGVPIRTVRGWRWRQRLPRAKTANLIVEKTGGKVTHAGIYSQSPDIPAKRTRKRKGV